MEFYNLVEATTLCKMKSRFNLQSSPTSTYSQAYQDLMAWIIFGGKRAGSFLEIGCNVPKYTNNTFLLSSSLDWRGVSIDFVDLSKDWRHERPQDYFLCSDVLQTSILKYAIEIYGSDRYIDYLQIDIDPCQNSYECLLKIDHDSVRFGFITFETDIYTGRAGQNVAEKSREFLKDIGYEPIMLDVLVDGDKPYEDWWFCPFSLNSEELNRVSLAKQYCSQTGKSDPRFVLLGEYS